MALGINDAEQATADALQDGYEQELDTKLQSIERLQDLISCL